MLSLRTQKTIKIEKRPYGRKKEIKIKKNQTKGFLGKNDKKDPLNHIICFLQKRKRFTS